MKDWLYDEALPGISSNCEESEVIEVFHQDPLEERYMEDITESTSSKSDEVQENLDNETLAEIKSALC